MKSKMKIIVGLALVACFALLGFRIWHVNSTAIKMASDNVEHYQMGEWVQLNGAFLANIKENTDGYAIRVNSAELISYNEYIERYALDPTRTVDGLDEKSVICLDIDVKNEGNDNGAILLFECKLIPERKNTYYLYSSELWAESVPLSKGTVTLAIRADSEFHTMIPFRINDTDLVNYTAYRSPIPDTDFELTISNSPVRKVIDVRL